MAQSGELAQLPKCGLIHLTHGTGTLTSVEVAPGQFFSSSYSFSVCYFSYFCCLFHKDDWIVSYVHVFRNHNNNITIRQNQTKYTKCFWTLQNWNETKTKSQSNDHLLRWEKIRMFNVEGCKVLYGNRQTGACTTINKILFYSIALGRRMCVQSVRTKQQKKKENQIWNLCRFKRGHPFSQYWSNTEYIHIIIICIILGIPYIRVSVYVRMCIILGQRLLGTLGLHIYNNNNQQ